MNVEVKFLTDFDAVKLYWPDSKKINQQLIQKALEEEKRDPQGISASNHGGYHSRWVVQNWSIAKILISRIHIAKYHITRYLGTPNKELKLDQVWVNVNREGNYNTAHFHSAYWSGFYCVSDGSPDLSYPNNGTTGLVRNLNGGDLQRLPWQIDNRPENVEKIAKEYLHPAIKGSMLIFPSTLMHYVNPYHGDGTRITISFNFKLR